MKADNKRVVGGEEPGSYRGWAIGAGVILGVFAVGLALWIRFHG